MLYDEEFPLRLSKLRLQKNVSAREMSLAIGQNPGYINNIESGKALPSMSCFFFICEYLDVSPRDFFDFEDKYPEELLDLIFNLKKLNGNQLKYISMLVSDLVSR
ncbi:MAG: helix-turn-helix transcriptional regulator [Lachnospiraceae bacterium]|nr:helix-turn-helix transcriptional regulator [Lachnospiraceae bacterium]